MSKIKLCAVITAVMVMCGLFTAPLNQVLAIDGQNIVIGQQRFLDSFDDEESRMAVTGGEEGGWSIFYETSDNHPFDVNFQPWGHNSSNMLRAYVNSSWHFKTALTLDLSKRATTYFVKSGSDPESAQSEVNALLNDKVALGFTFRAGSTSGSDLEIGTSTFWRVLNGNNAPFMAFEALVYGKGGSPDVELNLIALNQAKTANVRYQIVRKSGQDGLNEVFGTLRDVLVYVDPTTNSYRLTINGEVLDSTPHGEWIPASTSADLGAASQASSLSLKGLQIGENTGSYNCGPMIDTITLQDWNRIGNVTAADGPGRNNVMWYDKPAARWADSLPLGNGRIGTMIWGGLAQDTVSLNEVTTWSGEDHSGKDVYKTNTEAAWNAAYNDFMAGNKEAGKEKLRNLGGKSNDAFGTHRPFGKLNFGFPYPTGDITEYRRDLDLETSISTVQYTVDDVTYTREAFVSNPDDVMVMKFSASDNGKISFNVNFATEDVNGGTGTVTTKDDMLIWTGQAHRPWNGSRYIGAVETYGAIKPIVDGGTTLLGNGIDIQNANEVVLVVSLGTNFNPEYANFLKTGYKEETENKATVAATKSYGDLKEAHINDVRPLFNKMKIEIGDVVNDRPINEWIEAVRNGGEIEGSLISLWYQYARYLMIAGSRENSPMPMNLQGIWNDNVACNMIWTNDYHLDINIQMNQWMANVANLTFGEMPIFNFMEDILIPSGREFAQKQYAIDPSEYPGAWATHYLVNAWGYGGTSFGGDAPSTNGAWLAQEIMNYFDHTWDKNFLENQGYPMLKDTANFFLGYMREYTVGENTYLVTIGSSPEHGDLSLMPAYDIAVIYDIFSQVLRCYDLLDTLDKEDGFYQKVSDAIAKIPPYKISPAGKIAEWPFDDAMTASDGDTTDHRHTSHLLDLFPYDRFMSDSNLVRAAYESVKGRFDRPSFEHTEWTAVNAQAFYARLRDAESAYKYLKLLGNTFTWPNLMSISPEGIAGAQSDVYIIDGVLGMGQSTAEMLLQSHSNTLEFLPAIPSVWDKGNVEGMLARGAFEVDFSWEDYTLKTLKIKSLAGNPVRILKNAATNWEGVEVLEYDSDTGEGKHVNTATSQGAKYLTFDTESSKTYVLVDRNVENLPVNIAAAQLNSFNYQNDQSPSEYYLGDRYYSGDDEATFTATFSGTGIDVYGAVGGNHGANIEVQIDNVVVPHTPLRNDGEMDHGALIYSVRDLSQGSHTIKITRKSGGGQYLILDAYREYNGQIPIDMNLPTGYMMNDNDSRITYGSGWGQNGPRRDNQDYMRDIHYGSGEIRFSFIGTGFDILAAARPSGSTTGIKVYIDGADQPLHHFTETDFAVSTNRLQYTLASVDGLENAQHDVRLVIDGYTEFDGIRYRGTKNSFYNNDSPQVSISGDDWWYIGDRKDVYRFPYFNDISYLNSGEGIVRFEFSGTGVDVISEHISGGGEDFDVYIDGELAQADALSDIKSRGLTNRGVAWSVDGLENTTHVMELRCKAGFHFDGFVVRGSGEVVFNAGIYTLSDTITGEQLSHSGDQPVMSNRGPSFSQQWIPEPVNDDGSIVRFRNMANGMYLTDRADQTVQQNVYKWDGSQEWNIAEAYLYRDRSNHREGDVLIENRKSRKFIRPDLGNEDGDSWGVGLSDYSRELYFEWRLLQNPNGSVSFERPSSPYRLLEIKPGEIEHSASDAGGDTGRGFTNSPRGSENHAWSLVRIEGNKFKIINTLYGKALRENEDGSTILVNWEEDARNEWLVERTMQNGREYYSVTNISSGNKLMGKDWNLRGAEGKKGLSPIVLSPKVTGKIAANSSVRVTYNYIHPENVAEGATTVKATLLSRSSDTTGTQFYSGPVNADITIPEGFDQTKAVLFEIIPEDADGKSGVVSAIKVTAPEINDNLEATSLVIDEDFEGSAIKNTIESGQEGWTYYQLPHPESGNPTGRLAVDDKRTGKALGNIGTDWFKQSYVTLDVADKDLSGKVYVQYDVMFDAPTEGSSLWMYDPNYRGYIALSTENDTEFAAFKFQLFSMDVPVLNEAGTENVRYNIDSGYYRMFNKWHRVAVYIDTDTNTYSMSVDGEFIETPYGISLPITGVELGATSARTINKLGKFKMITSDNSMNCGLWVDNLKIGTYEQLPNAAWSIKSIKKNDSEIYAGADTTFTAKVRENIPGTAGKLSIALNSGGRLIDVVTPSVTFDSGGMSQFDVDIRFPDIHTYDLKVFAWDDKLTPISNKISTIIGEQMSSHFDFTNFFTSNMLLQAGKPLKVSGTALAGSSVDVSIASSSVSQKRTAQADTDGKWEVSFGSFQYGGNYTITAVCGQEVRTLSNVTFGDVYLLAGQSNMEYIMDWLDDSVQYLNSTQGGEEANNPNIRILTIPAGRPGSSSPSDSIPLEHPTWNAMTKDVAMGSSAIGYYFAQELVKETGKSIGLLSSAVGGTNLDRWVGGESGSGDLFNNRIYPYRDLAISGILFYQGENDEKMPPTQYADLMASVIDDYRTLFGDDTLPFYYSQLARYGNQNFDNIRAAQTRAVDLVKDSTNVSLVQILDNFGAYSANYFGTGRNGMAREDIHPFNKKDVAHRFALLARRDIYGQQVIANGPILESWRIDGSAIELTYKVTGSIKVMPTEQYFDSKSGMNTIGVDTNKLQEFEIAGPDGVYYKAEAEIVGNNKVRLTNATVTQPKNARYAFGAYPECPNLTDDSGIPSSTFTTELY